MGERRVTLSKVVEILVLGAVCFVLFLLCMPYVEESREEARLAEAWVDVRRLHDSLKAPAEEILSDKHDPWGEPYRIQPLPDGSFRVSSTGGRQVLQLYGFDEREVSSDMAESPSRKIVRRKHRQALLAFACTFGAWLLASAWILRGKRR